MAAQRVGTAVVTGGTGAIGREVCRLLVEDGVPVVFTYRSHAQRAADLIAQLTERGGEVSAHQLDATDADATAGLIDRIASESGGIHTFVHAGGPFVPQRYVSAIEPALFRAHVDQEVIAFFQLAHAVIPHLRRTRGSIVAVTSFANRKFPLRDALSSGAKGGTESLVRAIAAEEGRHGIRANFVGPGVLEDGMAAQLMADGEFGEQAQAHVRAAIPLRRFGRAVEVAEAVRFFASERASYLTGQFIDVDGGYQL